MEVRVLLFIAWAFMGYLFQGIVIQKFKYIWFFDILVISVGGVGVKEVVKLLMSNQKK